MNIWKQALRSVELAVNKCRVDDQLRLGIADLGLTPRLDLTLHGFKVTLDAIHTDGQGIDQIETLGVLGQDRREFAGYGQDDE